MRIKGSFIQSWYCSPFDDERWNREIATMKECGMDMLIVSDHKFDVDYVKRTLHAAKSNGVKICLGTGEFPEWWKKGGQKPLIVTEYQKTAQQCIDLYNALTEEEKESVFGWYFVPEISSNWYLGYSKYLVEALNLLIAALEKTEKSLPLLLSPYFSEYFAKSLKGCKKDWIKILREVNFRSFDILCPQDAIGAGWTRPEMLDKALKMYVDAIKESGRNIKFWINCEDFVQSHEGKMFLPKRTENRSFLPCSIRRFAWQLEKAMQYTDTVITFAYNHYHSPMVVHPDFDRALKIYLTTGKCGENHFSMPEVKVLNEQGNTYFIFPEIETEWAVQNVRAYYITKSGTKIFAGGTDRPIGTDTELTNKIMLEKHKKGKYEIIAEDVWGNKSQSAIVMI